MQYRKRRYQSKVTHTIRAIDVLYKKMNFYDGRAMELASQIYKHLKEDDKVRGDKCADMFKAMMRFNDIVIECAAKLAPYQSSKLESVEIKKTVEHRYVIAAPKLIDNSKDWLSAVNADAKLLPSPQKIVQKAKDDQAILERVKQTPIEEAEVIKEEYNQYLEA